MYVSVDAMGIHGSVLSVWFSVCCYDTYVYDGYGILALGIEVGQGALVFGQTKYDTTGDGRDGRGRIGC